MKTNRIKFVGTHSTLNNLIVFELSQLHNKDYNKQAINSTLSKKGGVFDRCAQATDGRNRRPCASAGITRLILKSKRSLAHVRSRIDI